jgi:hypothetical protein
MRHIIKNVKSLQIQREGWQTKCDKKSSGELKKFSLIFLIALYNL